MPNIHHPIPDEILALIQKPPVLQGESVQQYVALFGTLVCQIEPADLFEWLWVLNYLDCAWEILRVRRFKPILIDLQKRRALEGVILKAAGPGTASPTLLEQAYRRWSEDPAYFAKHSFDRESVPALAMVQIKKDLEALDKMQERAERRCDTIMQQLEYRREVFAHRARRAADNLLNAKTEVPSLPAADTAPATTLPDQTTLSQIPADEVPVAPDSSAAKVGAPNVEEMFAEASEAASKTDA